MLHKGREWSLRLMTVEQVAASLVGHQWVLCNGYRVVHDGQIYLLLNDATSADGAQEYAVCHVLDSSAAPVYRVRQVESLTIGWTERTPEQMAAWLVRALTPAGVPGWTLGTCTVRASLAHARCPHCM